MTRKRAPAATTLWLAAGLFAGLAAALAGLAVPGTADDPLPPQAAARVGDHVITKAAYRQALAALAADRREPLDAAARYRVLDRLVDEALLIQHGLDLGLVRQSPRLRDQLVDTVLEGVRAEADAQRFEEADVHAFYAAHPALFRGPDLLHVRALTLPDRARAQAALAARRDGAGFAALRAEYGDAGVPVPDGPLPRDKLRDYLGPSLADAAAALEPGETAGPFAVPGGYAVLELVARQPAATPPLEAVADAVRHEMRRRAAEELLAERLAALRQRYPVVVAPVITQGLVDGPD